MAPSKEESTLNEAQKKEDKKAELIWKNMRQNKKMVGVRSASYFDFNIINIKYNYNN